MQIEAIAHFHCDKKTAAEAARQGAVDSSETLGEVRLVGGQSFEQALEDVDGFSHLWLIYQFHHNSQWKPKVLPPRGSDKKVGLFATRSPYRPNPLGLSVVGLVKREGLSLWVKNYDLLDGSPIFDIKPYLSYADSFPEASPGWLENIEKSEHQVGFSKTARAQIQFLKSQGLGEMENFLHSQLSFDPLNSQKKRVRALTLTTGIIAYKTWRAQFLIMGPKISVENIFSGYSVEDLAVPEDPFHDKELHRQFQVHHFNAEDPV